MLVGTDNEGRLHVLVWPDGRLAEVGDQVELNGNKMPHLDMLTLAGVTSPPLLIEVRYTGGMDLLQFTSKASRYGMEWREL